MFSAPPNGFVYFPQAHRIQSRSKERHINSQGLGYGYIVYQDYLILLGTTTEAAERDESIICAYNLKEKRPEEVERERVPIAIGSCTGSLTPGRINGRFVFYGKIESKIKWQPPDSPSYRCTPLSFMIQKDKMSDFLHHLFHQRQSPHGESEILHLDFMKNPSGPGSAFSVSARIGEILYVYDPSPENDNFGSLYSLAGHHWNDFYINSTPNKLNEPCRHAIFADDVLYIFAADVNFPVQTAEKGYSLIEDIYTLNLSIISGFLSCFIVVENGQDNGTWEKIFPSGQVPGMITNVSLAEANGMIYMFGLSEKESVVWIYNISDKEWKQVRDIKTLTARPNQKAAIYEEQLLIIEWGYSRDSVQIQYLSLKNLRFVEKKLCKDQFGNFIQDAKNLFHTKLFPDVIFEVEGEEIPAHKYILAYRSDYFMKMFTSGMLESHCAKIPIPIMKSDVFKAILQYIYCNEVELDVKLALELVPVVDEYLMKGLKNICEKYLEKQLKKDNAVDILIVADRHEIDELKKACFKEIQNLGDFEKKQAFMKLPDPLFFELLEFQILKQQQQQNDAKAKDKEKEEKSSFVQPDRTSSHPLMFLFKKIAAERQ